MKNFYVGIDISKSKLDVAVYDAEKKKIANKFVIKTKQMVYNLCFLH